MYHEPSLMHHQPNLRTERPRRSSRHPTESRHASPRRRRIVAVALASVAAAYGVYHLTPWYRNGNRLFYDDRRPNRAGRVFGDLWVRAADAGLSPSYLVALETVGHRSGQPRSVSLVIAEHEGGRYLVSMLGERSPWVANVRAAGGRAVIRHRGRRDVLLVEVAPLDRAPIIKAYLARAVGGRPHIPVTPDAPLEAFERIAADDPVFRIDDRLSPAAAVQG